MKITNEFTVTTPIERAWAVLTDLEGIAPCMPGAMLTGVDGDVYSGKVKVKVGPVTSEFAGTARFVEKDDAGYRGVIDAKGRDARSAGNASALITARLRPDGERTVVSVDTDLKISGKLAQFGSGMIKEVSNKLLGQFVACLETKIAEDAAAPPPPVAGADAEPATAAGPASPGPTSEARRDGGDWKAPEPARAERAPASSEPARAERAPASSEPAALDLMRVAGGSITKRLVPLLIGIAVVAVVIYFIVAG